MSHSMKTLGVTGGIGSGKSTVCRILEELGARVFYADPEARRLMEEDAALRREITSVFGPESYLPDGTLNRPWLAREVFSDEARVRQINNLVHPRVFEAFETLRRELEGGSTPLLVLEAALIYESGAERLLDAVLVVDASEDTRVARVSTRDRISPEAVRARMAHQFDPEDLRRRADYLVVNTGSLDELRPQVTRVFEALSR